MAPKITSFFRHVVPVFFKQNVMNFMQVNKLRPALDFRSPFSGLPAFSVYKVQTSHKYSHLPNKRTCPPIYFTKNSTLPAVIRNCPFIKFSRKWHSARLLGLPICKIEVFFLQISFTMMSHLPN